MSSGAGVICGDVLIRERDSFIRDSRAVRAPFWTETHAYGADGTWWAQ